MSVEPQTFAVDLNIQGAFGLGIVSDQAFAAGAASVPGPWTDQDWDGWYVWQAFALSLEVTTDIGRLIPSNKEYVIDSKAMRKVGANETVVLVIESQSGSLNSFFGFRTLVKLS